MIIHYQVYWKDNLIGDLFIQNHQYKYVPHDETIQQVRKFAFLLEETMTARDWGKPIRFYQQMLENCSRFEGRSIGYHNNNYSLIKV